MEATATEVEKEGKGGDDHMSDVDTQNVQNDVEDKKSSKRSFVWSHFAYKKGAKQTQCPYCKTVMSCSTRTNGTSSLSNHLYNVCKTSPLYKKNVEMKKQSKLSFKQNGDKGGGSLASHSFNQERCRRSLARLCIKDNQPFSIVDNEGFRDYSWEMNPLFKIPSRWTLARDCLSLYKEEAVRLMDLLKDQTVSLTTDTWTSVQNVNYMCLTAHWVDENYILRKKILNFCPIANHKGETIGKMVYGCLQKWGIERVFTVTVDNASSNDGAIRYLMTMLKGPHAVLDCKYLHIRCCAHIINLIVRDGLEQQNESITRIRNAVRYVRSSPARAASFKDCVERVKIDCAKKPSLDVETRWNSTFLMLQTAEKYAAAFDRLKLIDYRFRSYFHGDDEDDVEGTTRRRRKVKVAGAPGEKDWEKARQFIEYLRVFYNITNVISGSKYLTSNMFFGELVTMHASISQMCLDVDEEKKAMAQSMKLKYEKYWDNIDNVNILLYVAVVLDPRNKMCYLEYCLGQIYGMDAQKKKEICEKVIKTLNELFDHYKLKGDNFNARNTKSSSTSSTSVPTFLNGGLKVSLESSFLKYLEENGHGINKTEVEIYLADGMEKRDDRFDVLDWWKLNSLKFPILSQIARHVLAIPVSTVASESAFSTGGRVIDTFRSSLTTKTAEALICTQDWIRSTSTPVDIELKDMNTSVLQEWQENLEQIENDEFTIGEKLFESCMDDD